MNILGYLNIPRVRSLLTFWTSVVMVSPVIAACSSESVDPYQLTYTFDQNQEERSNRERITSGMIRTVEALADEQLGNPIELLLEEHINDEGISFVETIAESSSDDYLNELAAELEGRYIDDYEEPFVDDLVDPPVDESINDLIGDSGDGSGEGSVETPSDLETCLSRGVGCETFDEECSYSDEDGMCRKVTIYRFHQEDRHCYSARSDEGADYGWHFEGALMHLFVNYSEGRRPIYRCISNEDGACHLSNDSECEGAVTDALLGYTSSTEIDRSLPLLRCVDPESSNQVLTLAASECDSRDWDLEGSLGYVLAPH